MAVLLDRPFELAKIVRDQQGIASYRRPVTVEGITVNAGGAITLSDGTTLAGTDPFVLVRALTTQGVPQINDPHPADAACKVVRHEGGGVKNDQAQIICVYERPSFGGTIPIGEWVLSSNSVTIPVATQLMPQTKQPLRVEWRGENTSFDPINKTATVTVELQCTQVTAFGQFYGLRTGAPWRLAVGAVNKGRWLDLPQGYWRFDSLRDEPVQIDVTNTNNTLYKYTATFTTKVVEDWSQYAIYRQPDGNFVSIDPQITNGFRGQTYNDIGSIFQANGISRFEPYRAVDFAGLMRIA